MNRIIMMLILGIFVGFQISTYLNLLEVNKYLSKSLYMVEFIGKVNFLNEKHHPKDYKMTFVDKMESLTQVKTLEFNTSIRCDEYVCYYNVDDYGTQKNTVYMFDYANKKNINNLIFNFEALAYDMESATRKNIMGKIYDDKNFVKDGAKIMGYLTYPIFYETDTLDNVSKLRFYNTVFLGAYYNKIITLEDYKTQSERIKKILNNIDLNIIYINNLLYSNLNKINHICDNTYMISCGASEFVVDKSKTIFDTYNKNNEEYIVQKNIIEYETLNREKIKEYYGYYRVGKNLYHPYLNMIYND